MNDCSNCGKVLVSGSDHFCKIDNSTYLISSFPSQGVGCNSWNQGKPLKQIQEQSKNRDPLLSWLSRRKKSKEEYVNISPISPVVVETKKEITTIPISSASPVGSAPVQFQPSDVTGEVNVKNALGWIIAAIMGGVLISEWLIGLL